MMTHLPSSEPGAAAPTPPSDPAAVATALSLERFARYVGWAQGDPERALTLYTLNSQVSEALYMPLQALEVALRNRIHAVLAQSRGDRWFEDATLVTVARQQAQVAGAIEELAAEDKPAEPGRVVAALTFSFWTGFFGKAYDDLWRTTLRDAAARPDGRGLTRKDFATPLTQVRILRNRIAHHEPILHWDLPKHHARIVELTDWLSPALSAWAAPLDRFAAVHPPERLAFSREDQTRSE